MPLEPMASSPQRLHGTCSSAFERTWTNLPTELLSKIAEDLEIVDLLRFRAVCKDWRSASFPCSAEVESSHDPWLLASTEEGSNNHILYNRTEDKKYIINIPELEGTICLASDVGWLLLSRGNQLFFFCPFTRAEIQLPEFPQVDLADHVAAFTCLPTSQECVVTVINRCNDSELEMHMIQHGSNTWNRYVHTGNKGAFDQLRGATYCKEEERFYYLDSNDATLPFSPKNLTFTKYRIIERASNSNSSLMPFVISKASLWRFLDRKVLDINENAGMSTCGTMIRTLDYETFIQNENIRGTASDKCHKAIWIHPRFHQIPPGQGWSV